MFRKHPTPTPSKDELQKLQMQLEEARDQIRSLEEANQKERLTLTQKVKIFKLFVKVKFDYKNCK